jgi:hypothetical protein
MRSGPEEMKILGGKMKGSSLAQPTAMGSRGSSDGAPAAAELEKGRGVDYFIAGRAWEGLRLAYVSDAMRGWDVRGAPTALDSGCRPVGLKHDLNEFKIWIDSNWFENEAIQKMPSLPLNFEIKYGHVGNWIRNKFPYWNFSRFEKNFELKFKEASRVWKSMKFDWNFKNWCNLNKDLLLTLGWPINSGKRNMEIQICELSFFASRIQFEFIWLIFLLRRTYIWITQWMWSLIKTLMNVIREVITRGVITLPP